MLKKSIQLQTHKTLDPASLRRFLQEYHAMAKKPDPPRSLLSLNASSAVFTDINVNEKLTIRGQCYRRQS